MVYVIEGDAVGEVIAVCPDRSTAELVARALGRTLHVVECDAEDALDAITAVPHATTEWAKRRAGGEQVVLPLQRAL